MKDSVFLTFDKEGMKTMRKSLPDLRAGEYAVRLDVKVDDRFFKRIVPIAMLELDEKFIIEPKVQLEAAPKPVEEEFPHEEIPINPEEGHGPPYGIDHNQSPSVIHREH